MTTLKAEPWTEPGRVAIVEREGAMVVRRLVMTAEEGQHLGFDLCKLCVDLLKRERTSS